MVESGRFRDHLVGHVDSYDHALDTGAVSAEQSAERLVALLDR